MIRASIALLVACLILLFSGCEMKASLKPFTESRTRAVLLVDVYQKWDEYGEMSYRGVLIDKKLGIEIRAPLERAHYVQFEQTRKPMDMTIERSLFELKHKDAPHGKLAVSLSLLFTAWFGILVSVVMFFAGLSEYKEEKRERRRRIDRGYHNW